MNKMLGYLFIAVFIILLFLSFILFDLLIRLQYKEHRNSWLKGGKTRGIFFFPKENSISGSFRRRRLMSEIIFQTPGWIENDARGKRLLFFYRFTVIINTLVLLSPFLLLFLS
jgi:hypothetical protein